MTKQESLRRKIIELIHGCEYEEVMGEVRPCFNTTGRWTQGDTDPITLGRLMKALSRKKEEVWSIVQGHINDITHEYNIMCKDKVGVWTTLHWLLTLPNGQEATLEDQGEETIEELYNLL